MVRRVVNPVMESHPNGDALPHLQKVFEQIALAKVSESAKQAREMGILLPATGSCSTAITCSAKPSAKRCIMAANYTPQRPGKVYAAGRDAYAALLIGVEGFIEGGYASEHDALIARKLAYVLTGGAISEPGWIDEQVFLDLERAGVPGTGADAQDARTDGHMLQTNKPLQELVLR